jgi:hypothetical protein
MAIGSAKAEEIIESVFDFDHVCDAMFAVRKNPDEKEAQKWLVQELVKCGMAELGQDSSEDVEVLTVAALARVAQFVEGSKASRSGCSGL